jgi:4-hydroxyphenylpyruvate dioxygenase
VSKNKNPENLTSGTTQNVLGMDGIDFVEFTAPQTDWLRQLFGELGFSKVAKHPKKDVELYTQNEIKVLINSHTGSFASEFNKLHGPSISSMGWRFKDPNKALKIAVERGARKCETVDFTDSKGKPIPAIFGIGDSLIYFMPAESDARCRNLGFTEVLNADSVKPKGFIFIDHLTNNVEYGTMGRWSDFYKKIFGFTEIRYFDIHGVKTGLQSFALRSPCGKFCIPINEASENKSQINEYLREYKGPGIQHLALSTSDILATLDELKNSSIKTLEIDDDYYETVFNRVPNVTEDKRALKDHQVLVDGDDEGYLLQIFTKNLVGPIFLEIIQRKNHFAFGEGNFGALFKSIEKDQMKRGVL